MHIRLGSLRLLVWFAFAERYGFRLLLDCPVLRKVPFWGDVNHLIPSAITMGKPIVIRQAHSPKSIPRAIMVLNP